MARWKPSGTIQPMGSDLPTSRATAIASGASHYDTGRPCKHGHHSRRRAPGGECLECVRVKLKAYRDANPGVAYAATKRYRLTNPDAIRASRQSHYRSRRDHYLAAATARAARMRSFLAAYASQWRKANPGKVSAYASARRCAAMARTPMWADLDAIERFYVNCPTGMHIDHVLPLRGRRVSGLHVLHNLQYLSPSENVRKSNRYEPHWPNAEFAPDLARAREGLAALQQQA